MTKGIRWEKQASGGWYAYAADMIVGLAVQVQAPGEHAGQWVYDLHGVNTRWTTKGRGYVKTCAQAKRSLERAWTAWIDRAGLAPKA